MRRWASFIAMRLISWSDQRIKNGASVEAAIAFFGRDVGPRTVEGHYGEGQHDE